MAIKKMNAQVKAGGVVLYSGPPATEENEQRWLFQWARMEAGSRPELGMMFHVPNGGLRSKAEAARFKAAGVKAGVPDVCLPVARHRIENGELYHGLYIELKRSSGGVVSKEQKNWIVRLRAFGYAVEVCQGWKEARDVILSYLDGHYTMSWEANRGKER